jgi:hypothetical protein
LTLFKIKTIFGPEFFKRVVFEKTQHLVAAFNSKQIKQTLKSRRRMTRSYAIAWYTIGKQGVNMKKYVAPEMEVIDMSHQTELLTGSGDNQYWKGPWGEPEKPENCKSAYWCD